MGMEVTAFKKASFIHNNGIHCAESAENGHHIVMTLPEFEELLDGKCVGCYTSEGEIIEFGTKMTFSYWRNVLALMVTGNTLETIQSDPDRFRDRPFFALFITPYYDSSIGPITSGKLAQDFASYSKTARQKMQEIHDTLAVIGIDSWFGEEDERWWLETYDRWQKAFTLASNDGFILIG